MYVTLKNNICVGVSNVAACEKSLGEDEKQIEVNGNIDDLFDLMGKLYDGKEFVDPVMTDEERLLEQNLAHKNFLNGTDWKVARHKEQLEMGIETSIPEGEYRKLLQERQKARMEIRA